MNIPVWTFIPSVWTLQFSYVITESFLIDASLWQAKEGGFSEIHIFVSIKFLEAYIYCSGLKLVEECKKCDCIFRETNSFSVIYSVAKIQKYFETNK